MKPRILLTTTVSWPGAARVAGGFAAAGCDVNALCPRSHPMRSSVHVSDVVHYRPAAPIASLQTAIEASSPDLVVPCDDRAVLHLVDLYDKVRVGSAGSESAAALIERSLGKPAAYSTMTSRVDFIEVARTLAIPAPEARRIGAPSELTALLEEWNLPLVMKRDGSSGGTGVRVVSTREDALRVYGEWTKPSSTLRSLLNAWRYHDSHFLPFVFEGRKEPTISVQRFVAGTPATTAFASWRGKVVAMLHADVIVTERALGPSCVVRSVDDREMSQNTERLAQFFEMSGLHGLDYIRDAAGRVHLLEINPRATVLSYLPLGPGRDLLTALTDCLRPTPSLANRPPIGDDVIALFPQEWIRNPRSPYLKTAYHDVPHDDPGVLRCLLRSARRARRRRWLASQLQDRIAGRRHVDDGGVRALSKAG